MIKNVWICKYAKLPYPYWNLTLQIHWQDTALFKQKSLIPEPAYVTQVNDSILKHLLSLLC